MVVLSYTLVLSLQNAKNWLYPTIDRLDTPILIIIPINLFIVQRDIDIVILQVKGSQSVIGGTILSIVVTKQLKALLAKVAAIEITLYIIGKDIAYRDILRRSKKSLKLSLELLIETGLANLTTNLRNDLTNISQITRIIILTQKKSLRKLFKY